MAEKMKSLVMAGHKDVQIWEVEKPAITPSEVLVQTKALALCTADQRSYLSTDSSGFPSIGGHETSGVIVEVGADVTEFKVGDRVVTTFPFCGECEYCKSGRGTKCRNLRKLKRRVQNFEGRVSNAGMAQYVAVPANQVCKIGDDVPFELAALTEPLGCCIHSVNKTRINFGETVVIIGAGIMGLLHVKLCRMKGARVIISEVDENRRKKALDAGANIAFNPLEKDPVEYVKSLTKVVGADVVINATSIPSVWEQVLAMLAPYGRAVAYASQHPNTPVPVSFGDIHSREIEIIGTISPTAYDFAMSAKLMEHGLIDMTDVLDYTFSFEKAKEAYEQAKVPGTYRVVILFD